MKDIKIKTQGGKHLKNISIEFMFRINGMGTMLINYEDYTPMLRTDFVVHCLSITHKTWIATDGMATYIVKLKDQDGNYIPNY